MKVRFIELHEQVYQCMVKYGEIREEALYFIIDRGALYKGYTLIADNTENSEAIDRLRHQLYTPDEGGLLFALNSILKELGLGERLVYDGGNGFHLE